MKSDYLSTQEDADYFSAYAAELLNEQPEDFDLLEFIDDAWED